MSKVITFISDGTEEVECLTIIDILRRAGIEAPLISISDRRKITSSHGIIIEADSCFDEYDLGDADMLFIPGGLPGTTHMSDHEGLAELIRSYAAQGKRIAAVCAGPSVIGRLGLLAGHKATCFPGWEDKLIGAEYTGEEFVTDGQFTTGRGLGACVDMALELVRLLENEELALDIKTRIQHPDTY